MKPKTILLHTTLFTITFFTTTVAGVAWANYDPFDLYNFVHGIPYSLSLLFILSCHEFGHYFAARYHNVIATLPFYIPFPTLPGFLNFGTLGAVIRTKTPIPTKTALFDIGVAGPLAGFVATIGLLIYGFTNLPGKEYILSIHPDYFTHNISSQGGLEFGSSILYKALEILLTDPTKDFVPPMTEIYHYPLLCAGWFGLFVTAMNLIPVGQLDGGHIGYAMFGSRHKIISYIAFVGIFLLGLGDFLPMLGINFHFGWSGWIFWGLMLFFVIRLQHPPITDEEPLSSNRKLVGWITFGIFVFSFCPVPFSL